MSEVVTTNSGNLAYRALRSTSFRQLQVFECVGRLGSFTAASRELHITQPTVSMQMKKLEEALNTRLFEQVGRRVHLTFEGRAFLETTREIFASVLRFESLVANRTETVSGTLSFAGVTTTEYFIPGLLSVFKKLYSEVSFSFSISDREILLQRLQNNLDDLYLIDQVPKGIEVEVIPFIKNPIVVVASAEHPLAQRKHVSMSSLLRETFLLREETSGTRIALKRFLDANNMTLAVGMELSSNEALKRAVAGNMGLSVLSKYCVASECDRGELVALPVEGFPLMERWYIVYPKDRHMPAAATAFLRFLIDDGEELIEQIVQPEDRGQRPRR